jgi:hypothetical protein
MTTQQLVMMAVALGIVIWSVRQSGGNQALRLALSGPLFLATRRPLLAAWALGAVGVLALLVPQMRAKGHTSPGDFALAAGIALICGGGVAVMLLGPVFFLLRLRVPAPVVTLEDGEVLLNERLANHFLGGEGRGGALLISSRRLLFRPNRFNVQLNTWSVPLADITRLEHEGSRLLIVHVAGKTAPEWIVVNEPARVAAFVTRLAATPEAERGAIAV